MNPFQLLGIADNASLEEAKKAWRELRFKYHPDLGGSEAKFKEAKEAWETIKKGYRVPPKPKPTPHSSFGPPPHVSSFEPSPTAPFSAGARNRPYSKAKGPSLPTTTLLRRNGKTIPLVRLEITRSQAQKGCTIPYRHGDEVMNYDIRPGTTSHMQEIIVPASVVIGAAWGRNVTILVQLDVI